MEFEMASQERELEIAKLRQERESQERFEMVKLQIQLKEI